ncbi:MAG: YqeG family HAD IIIA-type phosphatase [Clostridia bacterium]|nr:YqeG family HAD IIIA-type phosphatase [Clostridia bacterium]
MFKFLYPKEYLSSVFDITVDKLRTLGIDTIIFDIDNTLVPYWIKVPDERLIKYFNELREGGIKLGVLSNSREERSKTFCTPVNIPYVFRAKKPGTKGFFEIMDKMGSLAESSMIVGDQIFTDVWCGNKAGAYSVLVKQVSPKDEFITAPKRPFEKIIVKMYLKSEGKK